MASKKIMFYTDEDLTAVLKLYDRDTKTIQNDIDTIKNWMKTQPHLPEIPADQIILKFLGLNKCSIEVTKQKIDNYYSIRNVIPELFSHHPLSSEMLEAYKVWHYVCLPTLKGLDRVVVFKFVDCNPEKFDAELFFSHILNFCEVRLLNECCHKDIVIFDFTGFKLAHLIKTPITLLQKLQAVIENVYSSQIRAVHLIYAVESVINMVRTVLKPKIRERVFVHKSYESLFEHIPKKILPEDLGGEGKPLKELAEFQLECFKELKERFDLLADMKSNEELRPGKPVNDEFFGFYGNFKKIEVD